MIIILKQRNTPLQPVTVYLLKVFTKKRRLKCRDNPALILL